MKPWIPVGGLMPCQCVLPKVREALETYLQCLAMRREDKETFRWQCIICVIQTVLMRARPCQHLSHHQGQALLHKLCHSALNLVQGQLPLVWVADRQLKAAIRLLYTLCLQCCREQAPAQYIPMSGTLSACFTCQKTQCSMPNFFGGCPDLALVWQLAGAQSHILLPPQG